MRLSAVAAVACCSLVASSRLDKRSQRVRRGCHLATNVYCKDATLQQTPSCFFADGTTLCVPCGTNFCVPCGTALCMSCGTIFCVPCGTTLSAWGVLQLHPSVQTVQLGDRSHSNRREAALIQTVARRTPPPPSNPFKLRLGARPSQSVQSVLGSRPILSESNWGVDTIYSSCVLSIETI
jgi:hypothetical protein